MDDQINPLYWLIGAVGFLSGLLILWAMYLLVAIVVMGLLRFAGIPATFDHALMGSGVVALANLTMILKNS